ncbi:MAG: ribonuclease H-like domain-containing protein [Anaerolineales bacterium]
MPNADLRKRLTRVGIGRRATRIATAPASSASNNEYDDAVPIEAAVPGREVDTPAGSCYLVETAYGREHRHGSVELGSLLQRDPRVAAQLAHGGSTNNPDLERLVFLDAETTGLAGGVGTLAFLVGAGVFDGDSFHVYQFFLRDPAEEFALTAALAALLEGASGLVTFNGRSFDIPLLEARFLLARQHFNLRSLLHLDLLHPARRIWSGRLESCSLGTLEREVLDVPRAEADVPGWMIPGIYTDYLRTSDARELQRVFYHNAFDILSMVTLLSALLDLFADPLADERSGADCLRLAMWFERAPAPEQAEKAYRAALARPLDAAGAAIARRRYAAFLKRRNRRDEAVPLWTQLAESAAADPEPFVEIAKYYEWHATDLSRARLWTQRALAHVAGRPPTWAREDTTAALEHRLARIERKLTRERRA